MSRTDRTDAGGPARGGSVGSPDDRTPVEQARDTVERFIREYVQESQYVTGPGIVKRIETDARPQKVSHVINQYVSGDAPDGFLENVRVGRWSEGKPITWYFERVAGEPASTRLVDRKRKVDIVMEISEVVGAEGAETYSTKPERECTKISMPKPWLHDVLHAVCQEIGYDPELGDDDSDEDRTLREQIGDLGRDECSAVLEQAVDDVTITGMTDSWNKETCARVHEVLVGGEAGGD